MKFRSVAFAAACALAAAVPAFGANTDWYIVTSSGQCQRGDPSQHLNSPEEFELFLVTQGSMPHVETLPTESDKPVILFVSGTLLQTGDITVEFVRGRAACDLTASLGKWN
jgi:hypothetical protein